MKNPEEKNRPEKPGSHDLLIGFATGFLGALIIAAAFFFGTRTLSKEAVIDRLVKEKAIDSVTDSQLEEGKYKGILGALDDSYAAYYTAEETQKNAQQSSGTYDGIGIGITQDPDTKAIVVAYVYENSPAEEAGFAKGDIILSAGSLSSSGLTKEALASYLKENTGKKISFVLQRGTPAKKITVEVTPGDVALQEVTYERKASSVGYIRIVSFTKTTEEQFSSALAALKKQGMKKLIIDLRGNPGGLVDSATGCLGDILPAGLEVYTVERDGKKEEYKSEGKDPLTIPLVLLVNGRTASSAEIFTGACIDRLGAKTVGEKTFGKGIVQTTVTLNDGSSVKMTTAHYYTPNGTDINGDGFTPDTEVSLAEGTQADASDTDAQFQKAMEVISGE